MKTPIARCLAGIAALALVAGAGGPLTAKERKDRKAKDQATAVEQPYRSTYRPYPGTPTALIGATVFDGAGTRINDGVVLLRDGKVEAVGRAGMAVPDGYARVDGRGKFVTPLSQPRRCCAFRRQ